MAQEASVELFHNQVAGADCGVEPDVQQATQEVDEAVVEARGGATSRKSKRANRKKNGILQLQEAQAAADAAEAAAWASLLEEEEEAGSAREQEDYPGDS